MSFQYFVVSHMKTFEKQTCVNTQGLLHQSLIRLNNEVQSFYISARDPQVAGFDAQMLNKANPNTHKKAKSFPNHGFRVPSLGSEYTTKYQEMCGNKVD